MPHQTSSPSQALTVAHRVATAWARNRLLAGMILVGIASALALALAGWLHVQAPAAARTAAPGGASLELSGNQWLYRACVREARLKSLPVRPYPVERERISMVREGKLLLRQTERLLADVSDMTLENGCRVTLRAEIRTEAAEAAGPASPAAAPATTATPATPATPAAPATTATGPAPQAWSGNGLQRAAKKSAPTRMIDDQPEHACATRPAAEAAIPYRLLHLCTVHRAPPRTPPEKARRPARRVST